MNNRVLYFIDSISAWAGKAFAWCILVLTFATCYEVFVRYVLNAPTVWAFDMSVQMYGALFMMAGAYTLSRDGHVRGDVLYRLLPIKAQASIDLVLYILFFFPGSLALVYYGYGFASDSWFYKEVSWNSPARIQIYFFKTLIPVAGVLLIPRHGPVGAAWASSIAYACGSTVMLVRFRQITRMSLRSLILGRL